MRAGTRIKELCAALVASARPLRRCQEAMLAAQEPDEDDQPAGFEEDATA